MTFDVSPDSQLAGLRRPHCSGNDSAPAEPWRSPNDGAGRLCRLSRPVAGAPVFSPDGGKLAYQREEPDADGHIAPRIWLVDMVSSRYETVSACCIDPHITGHSTVWSRDSNTLSFYSADPADRGIFVFDFVPRGEDDVQLRFIPSSHGTMGTISPNGRADHLSRAQSP